MSVPISGLHLAVLTEKGGVIRFPVVAYEDDGSLLVVDPVSPRVMSAAVAASRGVATAMVSATLPRDQVVRALHRGADA